MFGLSILSAHTIGFSVYRDKKIEKIKHKKWKKNENWKLKMKMKN
jgi:hypothetical protein